MEVNGPIDVAKDWLKSAELLKSVKRYEQSLYAMEMAAEIALKAVLLATNTEFPKVHDIRKAAMLFLSGNKKMPKQFTSNLDGHMKAFETLLRLRSFAGYGFESSIDPKELEQQAQTLLPKCKELVKGCEIAIIYIESKK